MPKTKVWNISGLFLAIMAPRWEKQRRIPFMNGPLPIPLLIETRLVSAVAGLKSNQCHRVTCFHLDQKSVEFFVSICLYEWVTQVNFWSYPYRWFQLCLTDVFFFRLVVPFNYPKTLNLPPCSRYKLQTHGRRTRDLCQSFVT